MFNQTPPGERGYASSARVCIDQESSLLRVILNEVKDQVEVRNVYVNSYCRILILHFVQDDR
jgi:hypothetical protein